MVVTVFRSRLKPGAQEEYGRWATRMSEPARQIPGHLPPKGFRREDRQAGPNT